MSNENMEMFKLQARLSEIDADIKQANSRKNSGAAALLIAIIGTLIVFPLVPLWGLIGIAGLLAWGTNSSNLGQLKKERKKLVEGS